MHTQTIDDNVDISKLARKVLKKCKYIPDQWISQVEDVLVEIQERGNGNDEECSAMDLGEAVTNRLDHILELFYGDNKEQIDATLQVLSMCRDVNNLEVIAQHHQIVSALTRILGDQTIYSVDLTFNISKIFLALSNYEELHPVLLKYKVGSITMSVVRQECTRVKNANDEGDGRGVVSARQKRHYAVLYMNLSILIRLSDDIDVLQKMMKKGLFGIIIACFMLDLPKLPQECALFLLQRASIFGETAEEFTDKYCLLNERLVYLLPIIDKHGENQVLSIMYNLSFDRGCRYQLITSGLRDILHKSLDNPLAMTLLYQLTIDREHRQFLLNTQLKHFLLDTISEDVAVSKEHAAVLVNVSCILT